jgi:hypothetical protein
MIRRATLLLLALLLLAACSDEAPAPSGDPPILTSFDALPKQLATVVLTATPTPVLVGGETVAVAVVVTPTPGPPQPTATMTPYVGIFLGQPTSESGEPAPTIAPYVFGGMTAGGAVIASGVVGAGSEGGACGFAVSAVVANAYNRDAALRERLGCPLSGGTPVALMAVQPFERGVMVWRGDVRQIYALANSGQFWQVADSWNEGMPADDPAFSAPPGVIQPVRGFGLVWRNNAAIREALGWGTQPESSASGFWQDFERGALLSTGGAVYALFSAEGRHAGPLAP